MNNVIGIDIGGTNTKLGLVTSDGQIEKNSSFKTLEFPEFNDFLINLRNNILTLLDLEINEDNAKAEFNIGIGVPNYCERTKQIVSPPNLPWGTVNFYASLCELFPNSQIKIGNDANVACFAEKKFGAGIENTNFCVITVGTGIGSGIYYKDSVITGTSGQASEAGHIFIDGENRICGCGGVNHFESYCSVKGIKETYFDLTGEEIKFSEILEYYLDDNKVSEDKFIDETIKKTANYFAKGLYNINLLFSFEKIILAGGGMNLGPKFLEEIQNSLDALPFININNKTQLEISKISTKNGAILGAAAQFLI